MGSGDSPGSDDEGCRSITDVGADLSFREFA